MINPQARGGGSGGGRSAPGLLSQAAWASGARCSDPGKRTILSTFWVLERHPPLQLLPGQGETQEQGGRNGLQEAQGRKAGAGATSWPFPGLCLPLEGREAGKAGGLI